MAEIVKIEIQDKALHEALTRLKNTADDLTPAMRAIAGLLHDRTMQNFEDQAGPIGKWPAAKHPSGNKARAKPQLLRDTGRLANSISALAGADFAQVGTNVIYAAIHQLGGQTRPHIILPRNKKALAFGGLVVRKVDHPGSTIPPRPFLPFVGNRLQDGVEGGILDILQRHLSRAVDG